MVTGAHDKRSLQLGGMEVHFTGYLSYREYVDTLRKANLVFAITKREYTFLRGAWEAFWAGAPLLISGTSALRGIYRDLPEWAFVSYSEESVRSSLRQAMSSLDSYIEELGRARARMEELVRDQYARLAREMSSP